MARTSQLKGKRILIVEDEYPLANILLSHLQEKGCEAHLERSVADATRASQRIDGLDVAVVDLYLPPVPGADAEPMLGLSLADALRQRFPHLIIIGTSLYVPNSAVRALTGRFAAFVEKQAGSYPDDIIAAIESQFQSRNRRLPRVFIVHGHDDKPMLELKNYLQNVLKFDEPIVLRERPSLGRTIIEKFEAEAKGTELVFVLLTPDDLIAGDSNVHKLRARQNVIFELGYFYAKLQRTSGRVILLYKGTLDIPSDIFGIVYIDISNGIEAVGEAIRREVGVVPGARVAV